MTGLRARLQSEISPITTYGLIFLICVLGVLALDKFSESVRAKTATLNTAQSELATLNQVKETDFWGDRLDESLRLRKASAAKIWTGKTSGVIAANAQQTFQTLFQPYQTQQLRIRIEPDVEKIESVSTLFFDISVLLKAPQDIADILASIASYPKSIIILDANFTLDARMERPTRISFSGVLPVNVQTPTQGQTSIAIGQDQ